MEKGELRVDAQKKRETHAKGKIEEKRKELDSDGGWWKEKDCCVIEGKMSKAVGLKNEPRLYLVVNTGDVV